MQYPNRNLEPRLHFVGSMRHDWGMNRSGQAQVGWLLDGTGQPARGPTTLTWTEGELDRLEPTSQTPSLDHALDLRDCTALPALVDAHVHLIMEATADSERRQGQLRATYKDRRPLLVAHRQSHLDHGIAAVRDGGDYGGYALRFRDEVLAGHENEPGQSHEPEQDGLVIRAAGRAWHAPDRYGRFIGRPPPPGTSLSDAVAAHQDEANHVKIAQSGVNSLKRFGQTSRPQFQSEELRLAVEAAHARGRPVMVHANGPAAVVSALEAGCDSVEHGYFATGDVLKRAPESGTVWVPTLAPMWAMAHAETLERAARDMAKRILAHQLDQTLEAARAGVILAAGSDAGSLGVDHGPGLWTELYLLAQAGLSTPKVVSAATTVGAQLLALPPTASTVAPGTLAPGSPASWIAVRGSPDQIFATPNARPAVVVIRGALRPDGPCPA
jgi:imidazolonepropionase-like amidohydrolase